MGNAAAPATATNECSSKRASNGSKMNGRSYSDVAATLSRRKGPPRSCKNPQQQYFQTAPKKVKFYMRMPTRHMWKQRMKHLESMKHEQRLRYDPLKSVRARVLAKAIER